LRVICVGQSLVVGRRSSVVGLVVSRGFEGVIGNRRRMLGQQGVVAG
jgi:hypothetical protein